MTLRQSITAEHPHTDQIEIIGQAEQPRAKTHTIDVKELRPGHTMFEWDVSAGTIQPAEIVENTVMIGAKKSYKSYTEYLIKPGCFYQPALNAENAERHFKKKVKLTGGKTISELEKA